MEDKKILSSEELEKVSGGGGDMSYDGKVSAQILKLFVDGFPCLLFGMFAAAHVLESVFVCFVAVGSGFLFLSLFL